MEHRQTYRDFDAPRGKLTGGQRGVSVFSTSWTRVGGLRQWTPKEGALLASTSTQEHGAPMALMVSRKDSIICDSIRE